MTPKRIEFDPHAVDQMRYRRYTRQDLRWLLAVGRPCEADQRLHSDPVFARCGEIRGEQVKTIYLENAERLYVITVMREQTRASVLRERKARKRRK